VDDFISEDDLQTFEGWLRYQAVSPLSTGELPLWRRLFQEARQRSALAAAVGLMKLQPVVPGERRYAVAFRESTDSRDLWLMLWVRRSWRGEFFVMLPRGERDWDAHTTYHLDGTLHIKSHDRKILPAQKRQPLTGVFRGAEHLGSYATQSKSAGVICDPSLFSGVLEVTPRVLDPVVTVDLVEPGHEPKYPWGHVLDTIVQPTLFPWAPGGCQAVFPDIRLFPHITPRVVVTVVWW
jgi:hypothetical protein